MKKSFFVLSLMLGTVVNTELKAYTIADITMGANDEPSYQNCYGRTGCHQVHNSWDAYGTLYYTVSGEENDATMTIYGPMGEDTTWTLYKAFENSTLPNGVTKVNFHGNVDINNNTFIGVQELTSIDLTGVQRVTSGGLKNAQGLTSIVLPEALFFPEENGQLKDYGNNGNDSGVMRGAFSGTNITTIYCPATKTCQEGYFSDISPTIISYSQDEAGVYIIGNKMYATAIDLTSPTPIECTAGLKDCQIRALTYQGDKCSTQTECSNLIDMVSDSNYDCNSITTCSAYVKANNLNLASILSGGTGGAGSVTGSHGKRIYTVEEARQAVEAAGTDTVSFRIKYK